MKNDISVHIIGGCIMIGMVIGVTWYIRSHYWIDDSELAREIVAQGLPASECMKLRTMDIGPRPQLGEMQSACIYQVAQLTHDPRVCIRLMPSSYGISCIGEVWGKADIHNYCSTTKDNKSVECSSTGPENVQVLPTCFDWKQTDMIDACLVLDAGIKGDATLCSSIENPVLKSVCEVRIELQKKYPEIPELR